jgi:peptide deformylase
MLTSEDGGLQRPLKVKVKAQDLDGNKFVLPLSGWPARIFQHEYDHLEVGAHLTPAL